MSIHGEDEQNQTRESGGGSGRKGVVTAFANLMGHNREGRWARRITPLGVAGARLVPPPPHRLWGALIHLHGPGHRPPPAATSFPGGDFPDSPGSP